jgi:hypothetical protein
MYATRQQLMQQERRTTAPEAVEHDLPLKLWLLVCVLVYVRVQLQI